MKKKVKGFKGFDKELKCRGFQYEIGKIYQTDKSINLCDWGFHFCRNLFDVNKFYDFSNEDNKFCEIEAIGKIIDGNDKSVTNKIKIVREISKDELMEFANIGKKNSGYCNTGNRNTGDRNTGDWNTGDRNTGDRNTGDWNTGDRNTGDWNTGDCNTGNRNTGDRNTGDWNTGDCNTGDWNTGDRNTGNRNTGDCNTGNRNTGDRNTGDWNTGDCNTGDCNTGDWNKTNRSAGIFCTEQPKLIMFNRETDMNFEDWIKTKAYALLRLVQKNKWISFENMTDNEKKQFPNSETCGGYLKEISRKEASKEWWNKLANCDKKEIFSLPNFDLKIFNEIMELKISKSEYKEVMK